MTGPARELFHLAHAARDAGNNQACYENAHAVWRLKPSGGVAGLIGDCAYRLGKYREAAERMTWFFDHPPKTLTPKLVEHSQQRLDSSKQHIGTVTVQLGVSRLLVDGTVVEPSTKGIVFVEPGSHTFEAQAAGYRSSKQKLTIAAASEHRIEFQLKLEKKQPEEDPKPPPDPNPHPIVALVVTGGVLAAAGIGIGIGLSVAAASKKAEVTDELLPPFEAGQRCSDAAAACQAIDDAFGASEHFAIGAIVSFSVGGALGIGTLIYGLASSDDEAAVRSTLIPHISPTMAGVSWVGTF